MVTAPFFNADKRQMIRDAVCRLYIDFRYYVTYNTLYAEKTDNGHIVFIKSYIIS